MASRDRAADKTTVAERISSTMRQHPLPIHYRERLSGAIPKPAREDEILGLRWGCQPGTAHQRKLQLPHLLADVVEVRRDLGALESLAFYLTPLENAMAHRVVRAPCAELLADRADAQEDIQQAEFRANPCEDTARALLRKRAMERQTSLDHDREIAAKWGIVL
jgi:hypothetical protein